MAAGRRMSGRGALWTRLVDAAPALAERGDRRQQSREGPRSNRPPGPVRGYRPNMFFVTSTSKSPAVGSVPGRRLPHNMCSRGQKIGKFSPAHDPRASPRATSVSPSSTWPLWSIEGEAAAAVTAPRPRQATTRESLRSLSATRVRVQTSVAPGVRRGRLFAESKCRRSAFRARTARSTPLHHFALHRSKASGEAPGEPQTGRRLANVPASASASASPSSGRTPAPSGRRLTSATRWPRDTASAAQTTPSSVCSAGDRRGSRLPPRPKGSS